MYYFDVSNRVRRPAKWQHLEYKPHWSVLKIAAMHGKADMVRLLLSEGAAAGYLDTDGYTALSKRERYKGQIDAHRVERHPLSAHLRAAQGGGSAEESPWSPLPGDRSRREGSHPAPILPSHRPMAKTMPPPMMTCTTVWASGLFMKR